MSDKFEKGTGRSIDAWMEYVKDHGDPQELSHQELAALASRGGASDWWAQGIAVEIERIIGRRQVGQTVSGSVNAGASKTVPGEWTEVFEAFVSFMEDKELIDEPRISATEKWRYWRASLEDGSEIAIDCSDVKGKTRLSVKHDKLPSMDDREKMKSFWRATLAEFADTLKAQ
ncbi:SRPBCC domain-containing protein [Corynebacterium sp.]|uniref:SRPBCC domain-containing protein n=1 Tax=Corynebacterium sp. TaxID=1720 RepID=UPI0026DFB356|nr:SRPBCC domain-containing protein [Corynebacterium sp.]MDO5511527.1 hypothetical protein [Corynebacterium sp.]